MSIYIYILLLTSSWVRLEATVQKDILTYMNDLRHLHSAGPLISSPTISAVAQKSAERFSKNGGDSSAVFNSQFSTNHCAFKGRLSNLPKTCVVSWYTTMKDHSWCKPKREGKARPFINMIWNTTTRAGIGVSQGKNGKYYVVVYFSPRKPGDVKQNVKPVKIVTQASPKAVCAKGYSRFGSSCFKFHPEKVTWEQAVIQCANENATLTSVRNKKEEKFLRILQERGKGKGWMWIGLHDRLHEGNFVWLDGLDFAPGICAPVTTNGGSTQNCVAWSTNKPLSCWSDKTCSERHPFMCRMPIEGKLTYRVEILFKKFRWNPNFRNKQSKAFKDLKLGTKVTFNEVLQRSSGRIGGGLKGMKIKAVRPFSMQGRHRGTAITLSLQFRSHLADPTVKLQKFLRPSERVIYVTVDSPVIHKSSLSNTQCFFPCRNHGQNSCPTWSSYPHTWYNTGSYTGYHNTGYNSGYHTGYHNTGYGYQHTPCPTACTHYSYSCPTYCPQSCCSLGKQQKSPSAKAKPTKPPTQAATVATAAVNTVKARTPAPATKAPAAVTQAPIQYHAQQTGYTSYQPYSQCNTCHLYSSPYCYTYCDEACCKHGNRARDLHEMLADMRENLKNFKAIVKLGKNSDLPGFEEAEFRGNDVPLFGKKAKLAVKTLKRNIEKLEAKIKRGEKHFANENDQNDFQEHKSDSNTLPYFDEDELSDITDDDDDDDLDIDGEYLELEEPKTKNDYPHMNVHPDDKSTEHKKVDNFPNMNLYTDTNMDTLKNDNKNEGLGERHPDSPPNNYENSLDSPQTPRKMHPENKTTGLFENDFKEHKIGDRHPDSPPTTYENSLAHTQVTSQAESYPEIHPEYKTTGSSDYKFEEHATYHPGKPPTTYEQSFDNTPKMTSAENYSRMHPDNESTDFKLEEHATYHPDSPPATYEHSNDRTQATANDKYVSPHEPKEHGTSFNVEGGATYHPDSPSATYEHSIDRNQTMTRDDKYVSLHEPTETGTSFNVERGATYHPDSPPATYEHSIDHTQTMAADDKYVNPDEPKEIGTSFNIGGGATYHPDSPSATYEHSIDRTQTMTADNKYVNPDEPKEIGTSFNVEGGATTHTGGPPDIFNDYSQSLSAQNNTDVNKFQ